MSPEPSAHLAPPLLSDLPIEPLSAIQLNSICPCSISDKTEDSDAPPGFQKGPTPAKNNAASDDASASVQRDSNIRSVTASEQDTAVPAAPQDIEKQLRNLRKKIRQAEATASKAGGKQLTTEEQEKLHKLVLW